MTRKYLLFIFFATKVLIQVYSQEDTEESKNQLYLNFTFDPIIEDINFGRGVSISWSRKLISELNWGLTLRYLNKEYNSLSTFLNYDFELSKICIPINIGLGLRFEDADINDIYLISQGITGIEYKVDEFWMYGIRGIYNYNLLNDKNNKILIEVGVKYIF